MTTPDGSMRSAESSDANLRNSEESLLASLLEELIEAIQYLNNLQGIKDNNLQVRMSEADGIHVIYIEDLKGKVIRRIPELEIPALLADQSRTKGQLLDRAL